MPLVHKVKVDFSGLKKLKKKLNKVNSTKVAVGWVNGKMYPVNDKNGRGGVSIASVAIKNEFGGYTPNLKTGTFVSIPARPYFRQSIPFIGNLQKVVVANMFKDMFQGNDYRQHYIKIIEAGKKGFISSVMLQNFEQNAERTKKLKGHGFQWDDTGKMLDNFTGRVVGDRSK